MKDPQNVIRDPLKLESPLDRYFRKENLTFEKWILRFGEGFYASRNHIILEMVAALKPRSVFEFASSGGFLAKLLMDNVPAIERYTCSDFTERMVNYCRTQLADYEQCTVKLIDADVIRCDDFEREIALGPGLVLTTSFEHIWHDYELIRRLPPDVHFVFCVAGFDDPEHFRVFETEDDIRARYNGVLDIARIARQDDPKKFVVAAAAKPNNALRRGANVQEGTQQQPAKVSISVIVPFHNSARHIRQLFESLAQQDTNEEWEVVAVDNRSTDDTRSIISEFGKRLRLQIVDATERSNGSYARNVGVGVARGDKILFIDADDEVACSYVSAISRALESHDCVTSRVDSISLNPEWVRAAHGKPWSGGVERYFKFLPATGVNIGIRRRVFDSVGGFPEDYSASQDIAFSWNVQLAGTPIYFAREAEYRYRYRASLKGLYQQTRNWGFSNTLLYARFRDRGMPKRPLSVSWKEWKSVIRQLLRVRSRQEAAMLAVSLGYCVGRLKGSIKHRVVYL